MFTRGSKIVIGVLTGVLLVLCLVFGFNVIQLPPGAQFKDAAAVIFVVTSIALGIERASEFIWTAIASRQGSAWPFSLVIDKMKAITDDLDSGLTTYQQRAAALVASAQSLTGKAEDAFTDAGGHLVALNEFTRDVNRLAKNHTQVEMLVSAVSQHINFIEAKYGAVVEAQAQSMVEEVNNPATPPERVKALAATMLDTAVRSQTEFEVAKFHADYRQRNKNERDLSKREPPATLIESTRELVRGQIQTTYKREFDSLLNADPKQAFTFALNKLPQQNRTFGLGFDIASSALNSTNEFIASFKENPGKRVLSLLFGAIIGVVLSSVLGLDVFTAVQQDTSNAAQLTLRTEQAQTGGSSTFKWSIILTGIIVGLGAEPTHQVVKILQETKKARRADNIPVVSEAAQVLPPTVVNVVQPTTTNRGIGPTSTDVVMPNPTAFKPRSIQMTRRSR